MKEPSSAIELDIREVTIFPVGGQKDAWAAEGLTPCRGSGKDADAAELDLRRNVQNALHLDRRDPVFLAVVNDRHGGFEITVWLGRDAAIAYSKERVAAFPSVKEVVVEGVEYFVSDGDGYSAFVRKTFIRTPK